MGEWVWIQNVVRENNKFVAEVQLSYIRLYDASGEYSHCYR